jgi:hypothetical protein
VNFLLEVSCTGVKVQQPIVGKNFEVLISARPYKCKYLTRFSRKHICGTVGCCKLFSWLLNVILLLIYFPEANKISISLFGFPHIEVFPGWLPKFLSFTWMCLFIEFIPLQKCLAMCILAHNIF